MTIEENKTVIRRYIKSIMDADATTFEALIHPDAKFWFLGFGDLDRKTFVHAVKEKLFSAKQRTLEITGMTAEGDKVAFEAEGKMVYGDGTVYANQYHNLYVIRDGLIVEGREYGDPRAAGG